MSRRKAPAQEDKRPNYGRVLVNDLKKTRKGKHYEFISRVLEDLAILPTGSAVKVPLSGTDDVPVLNLRSALNRAAAGKGFKVSTSSDDENFYVWKA